VPLADGRAYWWAAARAADGDALAEIERWAEPLGGYVAARADVLEHPLHALGRLRRWHAGRLVLAGDAAHAMTPNLGQGAGQAIEDAVALGTALAGGADPLAAYAAARRGRAHAVQRASASMTRVAHLRGPAARLRDLALRHAPARARERQLLELAAPDAVRAVHTASVLPARAGEI
jgi:2-polyprenyl-6-methoxyphenol hydroxylase-like FAD-dependent oxidoreductase